MAESRVIRVSEGSFVVVSSTAGPPGLNGNTILTGSGAPSNGLGFDGDVYLDVAASYIYGPKAAGVWPAGVFYGADNELLDALNDEIVDARGESPDLGTRIDSLDPGLRVNLTKLAEGGGGISSVSASPFDEALLAVGTDTGGIYVSYDGGNTGRQWMVGLHPFEGARKPAAVAWSRTVEGRLWAVVGNGRRSTSGLWVCDGLNTDAPGVWRKVLMADGTQPLCFNGGNNPDAGTQWGPSYQNVFPKDFDPSDNGEQSADYPRSYGNNLIVDELTTGAAAMYDGEIMVLVACVPELNGVTPITGTSEVQTISSTATGGTFTLTFDDGRTQETTAAIAYNATANNVRDALAALPSINANQQVVCEGGPLGTAPITVTFSAALSKRPFAAMTVTSSLTGGTCSVTRTTPGVYGTGGLWQVLIPAGEDDPINDPTETEITGFFRQFENTDGLLIRSVVNGGQDWMQMPKNNRQRVWFAPCDYSTDTGAHAGTYTNPLRIMVADMGRTYPSDTRTSSLTSGPQNVEELAFVATAGTAPQYLLFATTITGGVWAMLHTNLNATDGMPGWFSANVYNNLAATWTELSDSTVQNPLVGGKPQRTGLWGGMNAWYNSPSEVVLLIGGLPGDLLETYGYDKNYVEQVISIWRWAMPQGGALADGIWQPITQSYVSPRSTDGQTTWVTRGLKHEAAPPSGTKSSRVSGFHSPQHNGRSVFAVSRAQPYRSFDGGVTWNPCSLPGTYAPSGMIFGTDGSLIAGSGDWALFSARPPDLARIGIGVRNKRYLYTTTTAIGQDPSDGRVFITGRVRSQNPSSMMNDLHTVYSAPLEDVLTGRLSETVELWDDEALAGPYGADRGVPVGLALACFRPSGTRVLVAHMDAGDGFRYKIGTGGAWTQVSGTSHAVTVASVGGTSTVPNGGGADWTGRSLTVTGDLSTWKDAGQVYVRVTYTGGSAGYSVNYTKSGQVLSLGRVRDRQVVGDAPSGTVDLATAVDTVVLHTDRQSTRNTRWAIDYTRNRWYVLDRPSGIWRMDVTASGVTGTRICGWTRALSPALATDLSTPFAGFLAHDNANDTLYWSGWGDGAGNGYGVFAITNASTASSSSSLVGTEVFISSASVPDVLVPAALAHHPRYGLLVSTAAQTRDPADGPALRDGVAAGGGLWRRDSLGVWHELTTSVIRGQFGFPLEMLANDDWLACASDGAGILIGRLS